MWEYSHEGKQLENKWVFRRLQKTGKVCADVMSGGRQCQTTVSYSSQVGCWWMHEPAFWLRLVSVTVL